MTRTVINVKVDKEVRNKAKKLAREMGLPLSTIINGQLRRFVNERRMEFVAPIKMSKKLEKRLARVEKDIKLGRNLSPAFSSGEEMDRYLDSL